MPISPALNSKFGCKFFLIVLISLIGAGRACAQFSGGAQTTANDPSLEMGFKPYGSFDGGNIDSVNLLNAKLNVHIPLVSYPQRGGRLSLGFSIVYRWPMLKWQYGNCTDPNRTNTCQVVWEINPNGGVRIVEDSIPNPPSIGLNLFVIGLPDGSTSLGVPIGSNSGATVDGSGFVAVYSNSSTCPSGTSIAIWTVRDKLGNVYTYPCQGQSSIQDLNGNQIITNGNELIEASSYTDTIGRVVPNPYTSENSSLPTTSDFSGCTGALPTTRAFLWNTPGLSGGTATYKICMATVSASLPNCSTNGTTRCDDSQASWGMIQSIVLPNGTAWTFQYDSSSAPGVGGPNYGDLTGITFPTGGTISYVWQTPTTLPCGSSVPLMNRQLLSRTITANDGQGPHTTSYTQSVGTGSTYAPIQTTVIDALGNQSIHTFASIVNTCDWYETQAQFYQGTQTLLKTVATQYHADVLETAQVASDFKAINVMPTVITTTWANGQTSQIQDDYVFDVALSGQNVADTTYGNIVARRQYDYGGALLQQTATTYQYQNSSAYKSGNLVMLPATVTVKDGAGVQRAQTSFGYDESNGSPQGVLGNQTSVTRWLNGGAPPKTQTVYNSQGMPIKTIDANLNSTQIAYDGTGMFPNQIQYPTTANGVAHIEKFGYDANIGKMTSHTGQNSQVTSFVYDAMGRLTGVTYPPGGGSDTYQFNDTSFPRSFTYTKTISASPLINLVEVGTVDGLGRPIQTALASDPDGTTYNVTAYDALGRVATVYNPTRCNPPTTNCDNSSTMGGDTWGYTTYGHDALGRSTQVTAPDGANTTTLYSGNCVTVTDPALRARKSCSDGLGRLTQVFEDPTGLNYETDYTYDALDNLLTVTQKGGVTDSSQWRIRSFTYDSLSRLTSATNPESGTISYAYDANGNLGSKTSPAPNQTGSTVTVSYCHDTLNRLTSKAYTSQSCPISSAVATYSYDQSSFNGLTITNGIGRRTSMTDQAGSEAWSYDTMGRIAIDRRTTNGITLQTPYTYNLDGSVATITYPALQNPGTTTFQPGGAGRPVGESSNDATYATNVHYAPNGSLCYFQQGWGTTTTTNWTFNNRFQPTRIYMVAPNVNPPTPCTNPTLQTNIPMDFSYSYTDANGHNNGNVAQITNNADWHRSQYFTYDSLNRIATAKTAATNQPAYQGDNNIAACWGEQFGYDAWGNLLSISSVSSSYTGCTQENLSVTLNTNNQIIGNTYDSAGNLSIEQPGNMQFTYDAENHLIAAAGQTYLYDGDGKRVAKASGSPLAANKLYWYDLGGNVIYETDAAGNELYGYYRFGGLLVAREEANDWVDHYGVDALGNVRWLYSNNGAWDIIDYYPFGGERLSYSNSAGNNTRLFTSQERDSESGLDNFGARYFGSSVGRFMTPDWSAKPEGVPYAVLDDPQSLDLYTYVRNNPLNRTDPSGHYICTGTKAQCQAVADGLAQARAALQSKDLSKEQRAALNKVVRTFGKAGDEHDGVTISFGKTQSPKASADAHSYKDENGLLRTDITFNSKTFGGLNTTEVGGLLVHERQHGLDGIARGNMDPQNRNQEFRTELNAYGVESYVPKGLGVSYPGLWNPNWAPDSAEASRFTGVFSGAIASTSEWCRLSGAQGC